MTDPSHKDDDEPVRVEAAAWFARMRGPDAADFAVAFSAWQSEDPVHAATYARLLQRWDQSAFLANSALARDRDLRRASVRTRRPRLLRFLAAAALLSAVGFSGLAIRRSWLFHHSAAAVEYVSAGRQVRTILLGGGERVTLDAGSAVRFTSWRRSRRVQLLKGRARFDIATGQDAPAVVEADSGSVASRGGQFDVAVADGLIEVTAWRGGVTVAGDAHGTAAHTLQLSPGQRLLFAAARRLPVPIRADPGAIGWTDGMLSFDQARLADAVAAINRYNRLAIRLGGAGIDGLRLTGAFRATDPEGFAAAVARLFHLSRTTAPDGSILLTPPEKA